MLRTKEEELNECEKEEEDVIQDAIERELNRLIETEWKKELERVIRLVHGEMPEKALVKEDTFWSRKGMLLSFFRGKDL
jgi:hypothetical protein